MASRGKTDLSDDQLATEVQKLKKTGPILELLEPTARDYNNLPQFGGSRVNCPMFDGSTKSHFLTMQGSVNFF